MGLTQRESLPLVFAIIGAILSIVAMIVTWVETGNKLGAMVTPFRICDIYSCYTNRSSLAQATAALLVIGFLAILISAMFILLFGLVDKLRTRAVRHAIIALSIIAGFCLLFSFCIWLGRWMDAGTRINMFGAGLWIDLVAGIFCIATAILTHVVINE